MVAKRVEGPRFRSFPTQLTPEGRAVFEDVCRERLPDYKLYVGQGGYKLVGFVSECDPHILRKGEIRTVLSARRYVGELLIPQISEKYRRRGSDVDTIVGRGAAFVKRGVKQKDLASNSQVTVHDRGIAFYIKFVEQQQGGLGSAMAVTGAEVKGALAPTVSRVRRTSSRPMV